MNASRPTRCLFCKFSPRPTSTPTPAPTPTANSTRPRRRKFHTTPPAQAGRRKPVYPNVKAVDMGLVQARVEQATRTVRPYSPREKQLLALKYTPAQLRSIEAGEASIDPKDLVTQARWRKDSFALSYMDDFSKIHPVIDKPVRAPDQDIDPDIRVRDEEELYDRFDAWTEEQAQKQSEFLARQMSMQADAEAKDVYDKGIETGIHPGDGLTPAQRKQRLEQYAEHAEGPDEVAGWDRFISNAANFMHSPKGTLASQSDSLAPALPKIKAPGVTYTADDEDPHMVRLSQQTGLAKEDIRKIRIKNLVRHRVVNQTRMGKIQSMYYLTIAGDEKGMLGVGEGKAAEEEDGRRQAMMAAIRNMKPIPRYENRTIFGEVEAKVGASVVQLSNRPPGFGNRCQHLIYEMARAAGVQDLSARCVRSRNPMNVVKATWQALLSQRLPEDIAKARGRKLVDVRKVYYEGQVY